MHSSSEGTDYDGGGLGDMGQHISILFSKLNKDDTGRFGEIDVHNSIMMPSVHGGG